MWPEAIEGAIESLDSMSAPVAAALLPAVRGLGEGLGAAAADSATLHRARTYLERLIALMDDAAANGPPDASLGPQTLAGLLGDPEAMTVDLGRFEEIADAERARLRERLVHDCDRLQPGRPAAEVVRELLSDHPDDEGIYAAARLLIEELTEFTTGHGILRELGGTCCVGPAPPSRRYAVAMMSWTGAYEAEAPAFFHLNPPDPSWDDETKQRWRSLFSATTLPALTAHEVAPGHFAHGRMIRLAARGNVRRSPLLPRVRGGMGALRRGAVGGGRLSPGRSAFRDRSLDRGSRAGHTPRCGTRDPRWDHDSARGRGRGSAKTPSWTRRRLSRRRAGPLFDPTYGRYTWGKLEIQALRDEAIARWGQRFSLLRFHEAMLELGAPPLGTLGDALEPV